MMRPFGCFVFASALPMIALAETPTGKWRRFAAATGHPLATHAALNAFEKGGNAVDAAVAAGLTLGVVDGHNSGIGGGCFILIRSATGEFAAIDAREVAPALARRDIYLVNGQIDEEASKTGAKASGVPGALAGYHLALAQFGKLKLNDLLRPAADIAEKGFPVDAIFARRSSSAIDGLQKFEATRQIFLHADGSRLKEGDVLKQTDLARTYRQIADLGVAWFYQGEFADRTEAWMRANDGLLRKHDLVKYRPKKREPLKSTYRGYQIVGFPPPSSGGVHVAQMLNMLEPFNLAELSLADRTHLIAETMKRAFADRAHWLGDPDFVKVPAGLVDKPYAKSLADTIDLKTASTVTHGDPGRSAGWFGDGDKHTTHLSTADAEGNWVALTQTVNTAFGSKVVIPGTGVLLNNQMDDFAVAPGTPNAFGLVGAEANAVAPGKKPLSSMSPTLVLRDGQPILSVGGAGGPTIISQTVQHLVNIVDLRMSVADALAAPRIHHQWSPNELRVEHNFDPKVIEELESRGQKLKVGSSTSTIGISQAVLWDATSGSFRAAADPRGQGAAAGR